jgi:hypothetical protein
MNSNDRQHQRSDCSSASLCAPPGRCSRCLALHAHDGTKHPCHCHCRTPTLPTPHPSPTPHSHPTPHHPGIPTPRHPQHGNPACTPTAPQADSRAPKPLLVEALFAPLTGLVLGGTWCFLRGFKRGYVGGLCTALGLATKIATGGFGLLGHGLALLGRGLALLGRM